MPSAAIPLEKFRLRATVVAGAIIVVSLALIAAGVGLDEGFWKTLVLAIATAGLSTGGISLLYEVYLQRKLIEDVLELVELRQHLVNAGIQEVGKKNAVVWQDVFRRASEIRLVPADPPAWVNDEWSFVIDAELPPDARVEVYLPNPDSAAIAELAVRLGRESEEEVRQELNRILRRLETEWKQKYPGRDDPVLVINTYDACSLAGIATADKRAVVSIPGLVRLQGAGKVVATRFEDAGDGFIEGWISDQLATLPGVGTYLTTEPT